MLSCAHRLIRLTLIALGIGCLLFTGTSLAAPEAHILRIDPRAAQENGSPVLTSVIEVVENRRVSEVTLPCATLSGNARLGCMSEALEKTPLYSAFPFPAQNAVFTVKIESGDVLAKYISHSRWGESQQQPGVGTAWLIVIDADARMGSALDDAKEVASRFVASMGPNDLVNLIFVNDRQTAADSKWIPAAQRSRATSFLGQVNSTFASQGRNRSLFTILRTAATDAWKSLGNSSQQDLTVPLHQAMVVLSSGYGGADALTTGAGSLQLQQYLTGGRFPEENTAIPKAPVPVISIYFPPNVIDEYKTQAFDFMQNLANPEIGGFFTILGDGQAGRAQTIVNAVRTRFSKMYVVKWRVSCVARSVTQTFSLNFSNVKPAIAGDNSFKDVPVGIDPTTWPLDVDLQATQDSVKKQGGVYPGGTFKVFGNFCWGGSTQRAEVYFLPAGQQLPTALAGADVEQARKTQQQLIEMGMRGKSLEATDSFVEFEAPDKDKMLHGSGEQAVARLVLYDNEAKRTSGVTANTVLQIKATTQPFPLIPVLGGALALVVVALLLVIVLRGGGKGRKTRANAPSPAPLMAHPAPLMPQPHPAGPAGPVAPGVSPEFLYGNQPGYGAAPQPGYGAAPQPGFGTPVPGAQRAVLQSSSGVYTVVAGIELHVGRDGARCEVLLAEPRISGLHASLKLEGGQLYARDENSNNGSLVNNVRLQPGVWTLVPNDSLLKFGPVEMRVRLE